MTKPLFSIRDELVGYGSPFTLPSEEVALREYKKAALHEKPNDVNTNLADSVLFLVGSFDDQSGEIVSTEKKMLIRASEVVK